MNINEFSKLDAQSPEDRMAQMTPEEHSEYQNYLDQRNAQFEEQSEREPDGEDCFPYNVHDLSDDADALASAGHGTDEDYQPDDHLESVYEDRFCYDESF